ncbi:hypothetical protein B0H19DRAFT_98392 [Mycena capillaripes]|nr:hypothetical protein B0H19DRAFT_98392 [Mycena capillaripes]
MLADLEADRARVADLEAQILDLERSLSALRTEKLQVQQRLDSYKYPVLTLPNEIVSEIFINFLPFYPLCPPLTGILSPTALARVCHQWRAIALSTPALWRAIGTSSNAIPPKQQIHIVGIWLTRSLCYPLSIEIAAVNSLMHSLEVFAAILPHCARWEYLKIPFQASHSHTIDSPTPLLRHLEVFYEDPSQVEISLFREAPLLRTAVLYSNASRFILPWAQLTSLTLNIVYPLEFVPILQQTSQLIHCSLYFLCDIHREDDPIPIITLPRLESLDLGSELGWRLDCLNSFIVPAVRSLILEEQFLAPNPIASLKSFISKSGCNLQKVQITGERSVTDLVAYCQAFPSISFSVADGKPDVESSSDY